MSELPAPMTPAECDLRGFEWMALHGHRLFTSGWYLAAMKDPRGGIAALKLWWTAMLQCPAGSLPNAEDELCLLADFGQDIKTWRKHRVVAMRGFVLCSDNRWYHPVVAEQALNAYDRRLKADRTREADRERLRRWRANGAHPPHKPNGQAPPETVDETRFTHRSETPYETGRETRFETSRATTVQDSTRQEIPPRSPPVSGGAARRGEKSGRAGKNAFHQLAREFDAEMAEQATTIDGTAENVENFDAWLLRLKDGSNG